MSPNHPLLLTLLQWTLVTPQDVPSASASGSGMTPGIRRMFRALFVRTALGAVPRRAKTLTEVLVAIAVVGLLFAITLPAVQVARSTARETQDSNAIRQLSLSIQQHTTAFDRLPQGFTGRCGVGQGWTFAVLAGCAENGTLQEFDDALPLDSLVNLRVSARSRPAYFGSSVMVESPYSLMAADVHGVGVSVPSTSFAFNGFLVDKCLDNIPDKLNTALFVRCGPSGAWMYSPEFYALPSVGSGELVLIAFADGSVRRSSDSTSVTCDPW